MFCEAGQGTGGRALLTGKIDGGWGLAPLARGKVEAISRTVRTSATGEGSS
jgi:hypothetical protein